MTAAELDPAKVMAEHDSHADLGCGFVYFTKQPGRCEPYRLAQALVAARSDRRPTPQEFYEKVNVGTMDSGWFTDVQTNARLWRFLAAALDQGGALKRRSEPA